MYAKGMTTRDIQSHVEEIYGLDISPTTVSKITDSIVLHGKQWQSRPLSEIYPIVFFDAIHYKVIDECKVVSKAAYRCLAIDLDGHKDMLGIWVGESEGANYWLGVLTELRNTIRYVASKYQKEFMKDLKTVYTAPTEEAGLVQLDKLEEKWGKKYPYPINSWKNNWNNLAVLFKYPKEIRKIIYTTNAVENLHRQFRKVTKNRALFPNNDSIKIDTY